MNRFTRRGFLPVVSAGLASSATRRPNVLLINTDDQRFDTIAALGNPEIKTPTLDSLVRRGFTFRNLYSQGGMVPAMCLPSRTMLMTGRSVFHIPGRTDPPPPGLPLLAKAFEQSGYHTYHYGKRGNTYGPASEAFMTKLYSVEAFEKRAEQSERHADQVIAWLEGHRQSDPFFIYLAPPVPHDPRSAPVRFREMYDPSKITLPRNFMPEHPFDNGDLKIRDEMLAPFPRTPEEMRRQLADYYATITCFDFHLGRIFDTLRKTGAARETIILFTSDQGLAVGGRHGLMGKQNLYEHFKSPLVLAGPGIRHGQTEALAQMHDLFPTLCDLAGIPIPAGVEGLSLAPVIRGRQRKVRDYVFGVYKDVQRMVRGERWKLIWYPKVSRFQLFDVVADPWELRDLSAEPAHAERLAEMKRELARQQDRFEDKVVGRP
ncbi:MAG: sulfatase-like hydrolase/transferase [Bryobacteraceae bacterium]|nr:sulfatase-like hydrolase/transferase [Bryobacteraceae bacterium]